MSSFMHPAAYASQLATNAQRSLARASSLLHGFTFMPDPVVPTPGMGIPKRRAPLGIRPVDAP